MQVAWSWPSLVRLPSVLEGFGAEKSVGKNRASERIGLVSESVQRLAVTLKLVYRDPENQWFLKMNFTFWGVLAEFSGAFAVRFRECKKAAILLE